MGFFHSRLTVILVLELTILCHVHGNAELRALMELKSSLDPTNKVLKTWSSDGDPCSGSFDGVACNEHRKVANISLQGKGLSGTVSPSIAELKCLSGLYLHYNSLSGVIPKQIADLTELSDLYLNVNNLSGTVPPEISNMAGLQVLDLCCNQLTGSLPTQMGSLKKLSVLSLQYNKLTGDIPASLGNIKTLRSLDLSFNRLFGTIPASLADLPQLEALDVRNNTLSGVVSIGLERLNGGFHFENNPGLCGVGFTALRACGPFDDVNINKVDPVGSNITRGVPESANFNPHCNQTHCSHSPKFPQMVVVSAVIIVIVSLAGAGFWAFFRCRRRKQKIGSTSESSEVRLSTDQAKEFHRNGSASPLVSLEYSYGWDPMGENGIGISQDLLNTLRFNVEEVESATQCFSEVNLLRKSNFSSVYKGILRDGSLVAIRRINITSCKSEEAEFSKGLNLLMLLRHENLVRLRGFCCSRARGECFLIYDFAPKGNLSKYLDLEDVDNVVLDWSTRFSIINGIAKGIEYLHRSEGTKPAIVHQNLSVEKVLLDQQFNPLIADSGLSKILADDMVFSALKTSAAMGYLAPEYVTTGRFTERSDVYAFGVMVLQIISGKQLLTNSMRLGAASCTFENFVDTDLKGNFSQSEVAVLAKLALLCTNENPEQRPTMETMIQELNSVVSALDHDD
ncbi:LRR receptor-like serine/threonine-protein kinase [Tripterygium wilfordii]|uniref:LRR receptor-like serine/threonine-protein kinase n=1 Tax=Tripterygium wilfordii TaxID=458696 RepID=A0A7J7C709_TRIWF|nr:LRR receptor-like serine/threonine-protein kinase GSO2 [Tripterygium wilfordii]KAF5729911.1 LRR receptor-like serine/threonine-protein kinase [Tripterygium wilfordii]